MSQGARDMPPQIFLLAQTTIDPMAGSVINLIGGLGSAAAAVVVVWFFLSHQKAAAERQDALYNTLFLRMADALRENGEVLKDNAAAMREFSRSVATIGRDYPSK
jgi:hypothetical protein